MIFGIFIRPFVTFSLPSSEAGRADIRTSVLQSRTLRCRGAEGPGVSWTVAEPDLDPFLCPLASDLFWWTRLMRAIMKQKDFPTLFVAMILRLTCQTPF